MTFYGSTFTNEMLWNRQQLRPARHIACPQRLKYIPNIKDGFVPYVEDSGFIDRSLYRSVPQKSNRLGLYNNVDAWRQELMGLAQQVQTSLRPCDDSQRFRTFRPKRSRSSLSSYHTENNDEQLLSRRASARYRRSYIPKPKISADKNEQETLTDNENQDSGIWLLPILCHILHVDNILEAQEWLVDANPTEKRLAMELISRTMQDIQNHENEFLSDISTCDQSSTSSTLNNVYWPYKFWQHQQQSKYTMDNTDKCERATSPVRILTPAKRPTTPSISTRPNQTVTRRSPSRLSTPMTATNPDRQSRQSYRITTSRSISTDNNSKLMSGNLRGKTPLI